MFAWYVPDEAVLYEILPFLFMELTPELFIITTTVRGAGGTRIDQLIPLLNL